MTDKELLNAVHKLYKAINLERKHLENTNYAKFFELIVDEIFEDIKTNEGIEKHYSSLKRGRIGAAHIPYVITDLVKTNHWSIPVAAEYAIAEIYK